MSAMQMMGGMPGQPIMDQPMGNMGQLPGYPDSE